jgi:hypothetical protein
MRSSEKCGRRRLIDDQGKGLQLSLARPSASCAPCETRRPGLEGWANLHRKDGR